MCVCVCVCVRERERERERESVCVEGGEHTCAEQMRKDLERIKILRKKCFNFKRIEPCHQKGSHGPFSPICTFTKGKQAHKGRSQSRGLQSEIIMQAP